MISVIPLPAPVLIVCGLCLAIGCGLAASALLLDIDIMPRVTRRHPIGLIERERDIAAALGWPWRRWLTLRVGALGIALVAGILSGVWSVGVLLVLIALAGVRFAVAGRAARRRLRMERAFLGQLRLLRDRMAVAHQSLDSALQEIGRSPGRELEYVLRPLGQGGSTATNIVGCGVRSRSAVIEHACAVLLWARSRSLDALIEAIDEVLLPIGEAQLAIEEESLVTLTQQRAVSFAMAGLMLFMFITIVRVDAFRAYYQTLGGTVVLVIAVGLFLALIAALSRIVRVSSWTRWNLEAMAELEVKSHV